MPASDRPDTEAAERRYEEAAAKVDLSDLAVVKRHVYTANPKEWPKPLLYALLAALASEKRNREKAEGLIDAADELLRRIVSSLTVHPGWIDVQYQRLCEKLANYHTATTEPGEDEHG